MYTHILFPTDGEAPSITAVDHCMRLAKAIGARVTILHVRAPFHIFSTRAQVLADTPAEYEEHSKERGRLCLEQAAAGARAHGVAHETVDLEHEHPYLAIIDTARERHCDLVAMASHGRSGIQALLIGSQTQKVLTHSHLPVLVFR